MSPASISITRGRILSTKGGINKLPPMDRLEIAMVFRNTRLPHMSVYDTMAFGLKMRKFDRAHRQARETRRDPRIQEPESKQR